MSSVSVLICHKHYPADTEFIGDAKAVLFITPAEPRASYLARVRCPFAFDFRRTA
jgi:hypothetical protein